MPFNFKEFSVDDSQCAMKVGTDSVLLGAWTDFSEAKSILDVGTGCGILALIAAQQSDAVITAIDIDKNACEQAANNFIKSKWSNRINCINNSLEEFASNNHLFDHIITNPPYFSNSLKSINLLRNTARHNDELSLSLLINSVFKLLRQGGKFSLIIPVDQKRFLDFEVSKKDFYLSRQMVIIPKTGKDPNRVMIEFLKETCGKIIVDEIVIRDTDGLYTTEYIELTRRFYLYLKG